MLRAVTSGVILATALLWVGTATSAATLTFSGGTIVADQNSVGDIYIEDGLIVSALPNRNGVVDYLSFLQGLHFELGGSIAAEIVSISYLSGQRFVAQSMDIIGFQSQWAFNDSTGTPTIPCISQCPDIQVQGIRAGSVVAVQGLSSYNSGSYTFPATFSNLDSLIVGYGFPSTFPAGVSYLGDPHFSIDDVQLAPVPLPATIMGMLGGLLSFGLIGFFRRRRPPADFG